MTLLALSILAVLCAVLIPYRKTVAGREEKQLRKQTISTLYSALKRETSENEPLPQLEIAGTVTRPKGEVIDVTAYVINTNPLFPPKRKEHRIVIAEKTSRLPRSGLF